MTQQQYAHTIIALVQDWEADKATQLRDGTTNAELLAMYAGRCEAAGIDYSKFLELREQKASGDLSNDIFQQG